MKEKQQDSRWLDEIRNEMQDFEAPIPADGWERVSSSLPPAPKPMIGKRWIGIAASVLVCAILGGGYYLLGDEDVAAVEERVIAENVVVEQLQEVTAEMSAQEPANNEFAHLQAIGTKKQDSYNNNAANRIKSSVEKDVLAASDLTPERVSYEETSENNNYSDVTDPSPECQEPPVFRKDTTIHSLAREEEKVLLAMNDTRSKERERAGWSFGLNIGGHGSLFDDEMSAGTSSMGNPSYSDPTVNDDPTIGNPPETTTPVLPDDVIDSKNHSSWSFGLSVDRQVWHRTTLESGLVYTLLTSDVKMRHSGIKTQRIHYLGIPLKLNYRIIGNQQCQLYASGGVMFERALSANRDGASIDVKPWQWSSNLAIGGQFRISRHLSLYLEPGVSWYFNADPSVPSLRSESPVYFNLRGGIRIHR